MNKIFISFRRNDSAATLATANRIRERLVKYFGRQNVFEDSGAISPNLNIKNYIHDEVKRADILLIIIGPNWLNNINQSSLRGLDDLNDHVRIEIETALQFNIPIFPLLVDEALPLNEDQLPPGLKKLSYINGLSVRKNPDFDHDVRRVLIAIEKRFDGTRKSFSRRTLFILICCLIVILIVASITFRYIFSHVVPSSVVNLPTQPSISLIASRLETIVMISANEGWVVGDNGTILHFDKGKWTRVNSPTTEFITSIAMNSASDGWAVGKGGVILHYIGGRWALVQSPTTNILYGIAFPSANDGWSIGDGGTILHYIGREWVLVQSPTTEYLGAIAMVSSSEGWAVGGGGTILHYKGGKWMLVQSPTNALLTSVKMFSASEGWAVGWNSAGKGTILHYTSGKWTLIQSPSATLLGDVAIVATNNVWVVGRDGSILHFDGNSWTQVTSPTNAFLSSIIMVSPDEGWAVGWNEQLNSGAILHFHNGVWSTYTG